MIVSDLKHAAAYKDNSDDVMVEYRRSIGRRLNTRGRVVLSGTKGVILWATLISEQPLKISANLIIEQLQSELFLLSPSCRR